MRAFIWEQTLCHYVCATVPKLPMDLFSTANSLRCLCEQPPCDDLLDCPFTSTQNFSLYIRNLRLLGVEHGSKRRISYYQGRFLSLPNISHETWSGKGHHIEPRFLRRQCTANARVRNRSTSATRRKRTAAENDEDEEKEAEDEEEEGQKKEGAVDAEVVEESKGSYPNMFAFLEEAFKDDREVQEIIEKSFEAPEEMGKRVTERVKRKEKDLLQPKTGSAVPMRVSFRDFDATDSYIWMELYNSPSEKDIDIIGSVIRSWYLLGCLGGYNSLNMQLTRVPINERLSYNENVDDEILPARFNNIGELEFQHNWGRFWVDLGTSDPLAMDVFVNSLTAVSSDYVGIKELTFGGKDMGRWNEEMTSEEEGFMSFKI